MRSIRRHRAAATLAVGVVTAVAGSGTSVAGQHSLVRAQPPPAAHHGLSVPFIVVARFSARSLGLDAPTSLAIAPNGNLYVTDAGQHVTEISPAGTVVRRWGGPGTRPGRFQLTPEDPTDPKYVNGKVAVGANGLVYVTDNGNARVQVFTATGRFLRQFGSPGSAPGQFLYPFDIAVDSGGDAYVADDQNIGVIEKFSPAGRLLWRIGGPGSATAFLQGHHHFTQLDAHERLVVIADNTGDVGYIDSAGHVVDMFSANNSVFGYAGHACEVTVDAAGSTYVTGCGAGPTLVYDRAHKLVAEFNSRHDRLLRSPVFGPHGEVFAIGWDPTGQFGGELLKLRITPAGA